MNNNPQSLDSHSVAELQAAITLNGRQLMLLNNALILLEQYQEPHCAKCEEDFAGVKATIITKLTFMVSEVTGEKPLDLLKKWGFE